MIGVDVNDYVRVRKDVAKRMFNCGYNIYLSPCNVSNENVYIQYVLTNKSIHDFDSFLCGYEITNCNYNELGKYTLFYVKRNDYFNYCKGR